jgi:hypothetical protein
MSPPSTGAGNKKPKTPTEEKSLKKAPNTAPKSAPKTAPRTAPKTAPKTPLDPKTETVQAPGMFSFHDIEKKHEIFPKLF